MPIKNAFILFWIIIGLLAMTSCTSEEDDLLKPSTFSVTIIDSSTRSESFIFSDTVQYPHIDTIMSDSVVKRAMNNAWQETLKLASQPTINSVAGRQEIGFYIYYDFEKKEFSIGEKIYGPVVLGCEGSNGTIKMPAPINNITVCAMFHTHTPLYHCPPKVGRETGPSPTDIKTAKSNGLPSLIIDYSDKRIYGGHPLPSPHKVYKYGEERRKNPLKP